jgi:hypothetical protein
MAFRVNPPFSVPLQNLLETHKAVIGFFFAKMVSRHKKVVEVSSLRSDLEEAVGKRRLPSAVISTDSF